MKFVHLAPRRCVSRICRNGIRKGNGLRGPGVYAVPFIEMPQYAADQEKCHRYDESCSSLKCGDLSVVKLWKSRLFGGQNQQGRGSEFASIIFELSESHWPILMFASWPQDEYDALQAVQSVGTETNWKILEANRDTRSRYMLGWNYNELGFIVENPRGLGVLLHRFRNSGRILAALGDDYLEILIPRPIPPCNIQKIVPYYERSRQGKDRGRDQHTRVENSD